MKKFNVFGPSVAVIAASILLTAVLSGCGTAVEPTATEAADAERRPGAPKADRAARFNKRGELIRPQNHREWIFVGAPVTPNELNDGKAAFPEFHNVYIDPASFAQYKRSGKFPDGTVILKELVSVGGKSMPSGNGYFQGEFISLEAMVKDADRFQDEPGGWAFFRFGEAPSYQPAGAQMKTEACNSCHAGATQDYVFTATYPVLRSAQAKAAGR